MRQKGFPLGISTTETKEAYVVLSNDNTVLTFYYDENKAERNGMNIGPFDSENEVPWYNNSENITTVVFDPSFNDARPTSIAFWFYEFTKLAQIVGMKEYLHTDNVKDMSQMFFDCSALTSLDVSNFNTANVTNMCGVFNDCSGLTNLDVTHFNTSNVTDMYGMFNGCSGLTSLNVSNFNTTSVTDMGAMFYGCSALTSLDVSNFSTDNVRGMRSMFYGCSSLLSLDLSNFNTANVTDMTDMFYNCFNLTTIYVSNGWAVDQMRYTVNMFSGCNKLVGGQGTTYDGNHIDASYAHADGGSSNPGYLTDASAPKSYYALSEGNTVMTFYYDDKAKERNGTVVDETVTIPASVEAIIWDAPYRSCKSLTTVAFEEGSSLKGIGHYAFAGCSSLSSITLPVGLQEIGGSAFSGCTSLTWLVLPNTLQRIGVQAFFGSGLTLIEIPASVNLIDMGIKENIKAFSNCRNLKDIIVVPENGTYDSRSGSNAIVETATSTLLIGCQTTTLPATLKAIGDLAMADVTLAQEELDIPAGVEKIGFAAFASVGGVKSIVMHDGMKTISGQAFQMMPNLTSVVIPATVDSIGGFAFGSCDGLTEVTCYITKPFGIKDNTFSSTTYQTGTLKVPYGTKRLYQAADGWKQFANIVEIGAPAGIPIDSAHFPDNTFRAYLLSQDYGSDALLTDEEIASIKYLHLEELGIRSLEGIRYFTGLEILYCHFNQLTALDLTGLTHLYLVECSGNKIRGEEMDKLIASLSPVNDGTLVVYAEELDKDDQNITTVAQVAAAAEKHWYAHSRVPGKNLWGRYEGYDYEATLTDGDIFTAYTEEGVLMTFRVISATEKTCQVGNGQTASINQQTSGVVTIPETARGFSVTAIGAYGFYQCSSVKQFVVHEGIVRIGAHAFDGCTSMTTLDLPSTVREIAPSFIDNTKCTVRVPSNMPARVVETINEVCESITISPSTYDLERVFIWQSVKVIEERAFSNCPAVIEMTVDSKNTVFDSREDCNAIIRTADNTLLFGCQNTTIPETVTAIAAYAFEGHQRLTKIALPASMTSIGASAFTGCSGLTEVTSYIEEPFAINNNTFDNATYQSATLRVPFGTKSLYRTAQGWKQFANIVEMEAPAPDEPDDPNNPDDPDDPNNPDDPDTPVTPTGLKIDEEHFPDPNFRNFLLTKKYGYDLGDGEFFGDDGVLTDEEISKIYNININNQDIADLTGIEYFTALQVLQCSGNRLTKIDRDQIMKLEKLWYLDCYDNQLTQLDLSGHKALKFLVCYINQIETLSLANCPALQEVDCEDNKITSISIAGCNVLDELSVYNNQLKRDSFMSLVDSLPTRNSRMWVYDPYYKKDGNIVTREAVALAKEKGWRVFYRPLASHWMDYEGMADVQPVTTQTVITSSEMANNPTTDTVVDNVYYNMDDDSYDSSDDCFVIRKATNMSQINDSLPGSDDVKENFTGMILSVGEGKGVITVKAKTSGNAQLAVQVGNEIAAMASQSEQGDVTAHYNVENDTYVFIYSTTDAANARTTRAAGDGEVRIYSVTVSPSADEPTAIKGMTNDGQPFDVYSVSGQKVRHDVTSPDGLPRGLYIINGRKVVVK